MSAHTPGPWNVEVETTGCGDFSIESASYHVAQTVGGMREGIEESNARLIAAAPDLLVSLQSVIVLVEKDVIRVRDSDRHILLDALSEWHDAIAKATDSE